MTAFSPRALSLENKLIGNIVRENPKVSKVMEKYFGGCCLKRPGFRIQTLEMACILFGVNQKSLLKELENLRN